MTKDKFWEIVGYLTLMVFVCARGLFAMQFRLHYSLFCPSATKSR